MRMWSRVLLLYPRPLPITTDNFLSKTSNSLEKKLETKLMRETDCMIWQLY